MSHSGLSELPELNRLILLELTYPEILQVCLSSREYYQYCSDEVFWRMKLERDYPGASQFKPEGLSFIELYRQFYQVDPRRLDDMTRLRLSRLSSLNKYSLIEATARGYLPVIKWLTQQGILPDSWITNFVALNGHLSTLEWLAHYDILPDHRVMNALIDSGRIDILEFMAQHGVLPRREHIFYAERKGKIDVLEWMAKRNVMI